MLSRQPGMWWSVAVEAPDPLTLARFYSRLLDWPIAGRDGDSYIVKAPEGGIYLVLQPALDYVAPVWPPAPGRQRPMLHLDFQVADLDEAVEEAVGLGAVLAEVQPNASVRVLFDPAGHPFCLSANE